MLKILCIVISGIMALMLVIYKKSSIVSKLGTVAWAYILGICFSVIMNGITQNAFRIECVEIMEVIAYISIAIGIPLILLANSISDLKSVSRDVKKTFLLLIFSVILVTLIIHFIYTKGVENGEVLSGMALAIYTGGTPNLNAVAYIFNLDSKTLLAANLSDIVIGGVFYLFVIFLAKVLFRGRSSNLQSFDSAKTRCKHSSKRGAVINLLIAIAFAFLSAGLGALIWALTGKVEGRLTDYVVPAMMIGTSVGGIILSKNEKMSSIRENAAMGEFFVTLFSFAIASLMDIDALKDISNGIFVVFLSITVSTFFVHMILCKLFHIDLKLMMVTSIAGIYGPAFIPGVCSALNVEELVTPGLIMGSLGYVIGTFLGCGLVLML